MKSDRIRRGISLCCLLLGICFLAIPKLEDFYTGYRQEKLIADWQQNFQDLDGPDEKKDSRDKASADSITQEVLPETSTDVDTGTVNKAAAAGDNKNGDIQNMDGTIEGILIIDKIDLKLPILTEATPQNLKVSVSSIKGTGNPGAIGNYAIAGHRSKAYGKNFNRLDELSEEDVILVTTHEKEYVYKITEKLHVQPDEVWVLEGDGKSKEITLVTCDPVNDPYQRLIVKGILIDQK